MDEHDSTMSGGKQTYKLNMIHFNHLCYETKPVSDTSQLFRRFLAVSRLGAIKNEGGSIMWLTLDRRCHGGARRKMSLSNKSSSKIRIPGKSRDREIKEGTAAKPKIS